MQNQKSLRPEVISLAMDNCSTHSQITPCNAALKNRCDVILIIMINDENVKLKFTFSWKSWRAVEPKADMKEFLCTGCGTGGGGCVDHGDGDECAPSHDIDCASLAVTPRMARQPPLGNVYLHFHISETNPPKCAYFKAYFRATPCIVCILSIWTFDLNLPLCLDKVHSCDFREPTIKLENEIDQNIARIALEKTDLEAVHILKRLLDPLSLIGLFLC